MKSKKNYNDKEYLKLAVELSKKSYIPPGKNYPKVGSVVVDKDGKIIGSWKNGKLHAEYQILHNLSRNSLRGAILYTTLEPCTQRNNSNDLSCSEHIVRTGISRVVIGMLDPNPAISGKSIFYLRKNGIKVKLTKEYESEIRKLNKKFFAKKRVIFFDLWGTLIKKNFVKKNDLFDLLSKILKSKDRDKIKEISIKNKFRNFNSWINEIEKCLGKEITDEQKKKISEIIKKDEKIELYPETIQTLKKLKKAGYKIAILSNVWQFGLQKIKKQFNNLVDKQFYSCELGMAKPDKDIFIKACKVFGIDLQDAIMVGDSYKYDIKGATNANFGRVFWIKRKKQKKSVKNIKKVKNLKGILPHLIYKKIIKRRKNDCMVRKMES